MWRATQLRDVGTVPKAATWGHHLSNRPLYLGRSCPGRSAEPPGKTKSNKWPGSSVQRHHSRHLRRTALDTAASEALHRNMEETLRNYLPGTHHPCGTSISRTVVNSTGSLAPATPILELLPLRGLHGLQVVGEIVRFTPYYGVFSVPAVRARRKQAARIRPQSRWKR
jgi:hypothetical protein